jgi:hypothetical protein
MCKVQWSHQTEEEATWEREQELKPEFPRFYSNPYESWGRESFFLHPMMASRLMHGRPIPSECAMVKVTTIKEGH